MVIEACFSVYKEMKELSYNKLNNNFQTENLMLPSGYINVLFSSESKKANLQM